MMAADLNGPPIRWDPISFTSLKPDYNYAYFCFQYWINPTIPSFISQKATYTNMDFQQKYE